MTKAEIAAMNDGSVRVQLRMPQDAVADLAGVCRPTISRYELSPLGVHDPGKRAACAKVYAQLRVLLGREWLSSSEAAA